MMWVDPGGGRDAVPLESALVIVARHTRGSALIRALHKEIADVIDTDNLWRKVLGTLGRCNGGLTF